MPQTYRLVSDLIPVAQLNQLRENDQATWKDASLRVAPVVRLYAPDGPAVWLLSELAADGDTAYGLCDLGLGFPELGVVSLREIGNVRGQEGRLIECDPDFKPTATVDEYADLARAAGRIER